MLITIHHEVSNYCVCTMWINFKTPLVRPTAGLLTSLSRARDVLVGFAPDGGARRGEEGGALVLGASLGLQQLNGDFVLAGEQQTWEVDVVFLRKK